MFTQRIVHTMNREIQMGLTFEYVELGRAFTESKKCATFVAHVHLMCVCLLISSENRKSQGESHFIHFTITTIYLKSRALSIIIIIYASRVKLWFFLVLFQFRNTFCTNSQKKCNALVCISSNMNLYEMKKMPQHIRSLLLLRLNYVNGLMLFNNK